MNRRFGLVSLGVVFVVSACIAVGHSVSAQDVPEFTGRVVDNAKILSPETEATLVKMLAEHEVSTSNQIAVLTIPTLGGEAIEDYSLRVARSWELGTADNNNGVLLLIAVADREMRIEVGFGLEGSLTDVASSRIIRGEIRPRFRAEDFDGGIRSEEHTSELQSH